MGIHSFPKGHGTLFASIYIYINLGISLSPGNVAEMKSLPSDLRDVMVEIVTGRRENMEEEEEEGREKRRTKSTGNGNYRIALIFRGSTFS